ncbi:MAG: slipin family protein [Candidatus Omnitrophica bacterium]|nr:slipin family protein [Candidatus Omnitrophota bacterium]
MFVILFLFVIWLVNSVRFPKEYERLVVFRLGRALPEPRGPGFCFILWPIDLATMITTRLIAFDVPPQDVITKDNVSVKVNAVVFYRVIDPIRATVEVENYNYATSQMAQTTLRTILGEMEFDELLAKREMINEKLQTLLDRQTDPWGIKVTHVEIKDVDISEDLRKAMARQAQAEREKRAKIIAADGEFVAAAKICQAAEMMEKYPVAIQLRYLQTLVEIGGDKNTTTIFPLPIDFLKGILNSKKD